jgi:hypothetical protein
MTLFKSLFQYLMFSGTMFFAAGAPAIYGGNDGAVDNGGDSGDAGGADAALGEGGADQGPADSVSADPLGESEEPVDKPQTPQEEPEVSEFKGFASSRLKALIKQAPELGKILQANPKIQQELEARFRRDAAYREVFPTVAEARQMRERFPNGLADVQALETDLKEVEQLDTLFYTKDVDGSYSGHSQLLSNMLTDDRPATLSLFKEVPKIWAQQDRQSYNEVFGSIIGATLVNMRTPHALAKIVELAKDNPQIRELAEEQLGMIEGFNAAKPTASVEEQRLARERQQFDKQKAENAKVDGQKFHNTFLAESRKLQTDIISKHPAVARLAQVKSISDQKRTEIINKIRQETEQFLGKSASFMRKLRPAYDSRNLSETVALQKAAWSQAWLLNQMVRRVLRVETPQMVQQNRDAVKRRTPQPAAKSTGDTKVTPKGPRHVNGQWYKEDGSRYSAQEILAGKHLQA